MMDTAIPSIGGRQLTAIADAPDLRDYIYQPALVSLPASVPVVPGKLHIRDQGTEGACTGFGLAASMICCLPRISVNTRSVPGCCTKWRADMMNGPANPMKAPVAVGPLRVGTTWGCVMSRCIHICHLTKANSPLMRLKMLERIPLVHITD